MNDGTAIDPLAERIANDVGWPGLIAINATLDWLRGHPEELVNMQEKK